MSERMLAGLSRRRFLRGGALAGGAVAASQLVRAPTAGADVLTGYVPMTEVGAANGVAATDANGRVFVKESPFTSGVWSPADWGRTGGWANARADASSRLVSVVGFGDSIMQGAFSSNWATMSWFGLLASQLQAAYGDGGSGLNSTCNVGGQAIGNITTSGSGRGFGGWYALGAGLNSYSLYPGGGATGLTLTFSNVRGSQIEIWYYPSSANPSTFTYSVDGAAPVSVNAYGPTTTLAQAVVSGLSSGNHTVVVTATAGVPIIAAVGGFNPTGVVAHNMGHAGRSSPDVMTSTGLTSPGWTTTGAASIQQLAPDLLVYEMGINDIAASVTPATYAQMAAFACDFAKAGNPQCDIVLVGANRGATVDPNALYPSYMRELRAVADSYGALFVNFWPIGRNSYAYWSSLGYWSDGGGDGLAGTNPVHPSNAGHAFMASVLNPLLGAA